MNREVFTKDQLAKPQGLSMLALQYNVFIHDVDKLISLNSQLLMTKGWWGGGGVSSSSLLISQTKLIAAQQWNKTDFHHCMPAQLKLVLV